MTINDNSNAYAPQQQVIELLQAALTLLDEHDGPMDVRARLEELVEQLGQWR